MYESLQGIPGVVAIEADDTGKNRSLAMKGEREGGFDDKYEDDYRPLFNT